MALVILGLVLFVLLVVAHEYGHFLVAKLSGVDVEEFGVGFPPKIYGKKMGKGIFKSYYSINALPLGGFVRLKGEHDADKSKGSFGSANTKAKIRIMLAGVSVNLLIALIMFMVVAWLGMPQMVEKQFMIKSDTRVLHSQVIANFVDTGAPADKIGLRPGDTVTKVGDRVITTEVELHAATKFYAGRAVTVKYDRKGDKLSGSATLLSNQEVTASQSTDNPKGYLGVGATDYQLTRSTWSAPIQAVGLSVQFATLTLKGIGTALANLGKAFVSLITGNGHKAKQNIGDAGQNVSGPVGIYAILQQGSSLGYQFTLFVIALISLTLAIMNFLPIPALDGGRAFVTLLFRALKKPLSAKTEDLIHGSGFVALIILFIVITIVDVRRFY